MSVRRRSAGLSLLVVVGTARAVEPTPPEDVFRAYADAMAAGDLAAARQWVVADASRLRLVIARPAAAEAERNFRTAIDQKFPGQQKDIVYTGATTRPDDAPGGPRIIYGKDTATLIVRDSAETVRFRRVDGEWKVDLNAMFSPTTVDETERFRGALIEVMNALAAEVKAGHYQKLDEVQAELATRIKMRLVTPDLPATTRPAF